MIVFHPPQTQMANVMFIYACAKCLAIKNDTSFCLAEGLEKLHYFDIPDTVAVNKLKYGAFKIHNKVALKKYKFFHNQDYRNDFSLTMKNETNKNLWYYGYFQNTNYFMGFDDEVKSWFTIKQVYKNQYEKAIQQLNPQGKKVISVHIRLKDYKTFGPDFLGGPDLTLPMNYYHNLLKQFDENEYQIIFMSDDIEEVKKEFGNIKSARFSTENSIVDFQIIQHANVCINAHSTFSWWAAWLNKNEDKKVFVPNNFLGFKIGVETPKNIIPKGWNRVDV